MSRSLKDVNQDVSESADQVISSVLDRLLVGLDTLDDVVQSDQTLYSFVEVATVLEVLNILHDVIYLALRHCIERLFLWRTFHFLYLLSEVLIIVHEVHLIVTRRVEVKSVSDVAVSAKVSSKNIVL